MTKRILPRYNRAKLDGPEFIELSWHSADGKKVKIKDMPLDHFVNVLNWIEKNPMLYMDVLPGFLKFAELKTTVLFAAKERYPLRVDGKWQIVDPVKGAVTNAAPPPPGYAEAVKEKYGDDFYETTFGTR